MKLTAKQESFAQAIASGMNQSDAYRAAFKGGQTSTLKTCNEKGSRVMADARVQERVAELRAPAVERAQITLESHLKDLAILRNAAVKKEQYSAAISAEIARGKHAGVVAAEKREITGAGGAPIQISSASIAFVKNLTPEQRRMLASLRVPHAG